MRAAAERGCRAGRTKPVAVPAYTLSGVLRPRLACFRRYGRKLAKSGSKIAKRIAKVAFARKLAVLLHALLVTGEVYEPLRKIHARRLIEGDSVLGGRLGALPS